jgi:hypothetical protein
MKAGQFGTVLSTPAPPQPALFAKVTIHPSSERTSSPLTNFADNHVSFI